MVELIYHRILGPDTRADAVIRTGTAARISVGCMIDLRLGQLGRHHIGRINTRL